MPFERPADVAEAPPPQRIAPAPFELPRGRRPTWPTLAALAFATGLVAVGLGVWSVFAETRADRRAGSDPDLDRAVAVLADSSAARYPLRGSVGRVALVATENGSAVIALNGLGPAPDGRSYRVWVVAPGSATPVADVAFSGSERAVPLERRLVTGTRVAVTLEPSGDVVSPSRPLRLSTVWP